MKLVEFSNGKFGIRTKWFFGWYYLDLITSQHSWRANTRYFGDCQGSRKAAKKGARHHVRGYKIVGPI